MENDASYFMLVLALVPLVYIIRFYYLASSRCHNRGLRLPPGPWQLPVIGSLHHLFGALPHRALRDLSRRHGPLMLLMFGANRPVIVVSTAKAAKEMMKTHDTTFCARPLTSALKAISKHGLGIVFAPYGDHWRQMRKICFLELLSAKRIASFSSIRGEETDRFIRSIVATLEPVVNLSELLAAYLTDTTVHMIMGGQFTEQETLLRHVDEAVGIVSGVALPDLFPSSRLARALSTTLHSAEVFREAFLALMGHAIDDHLESRRSASSSEQVEQEDIIDVLLRVQGEGNLEPPLTMNNIKAVVFDLLAGGTETTSTTLQWAMAELMRNPSIMTRAQDEVRGAFMGQNKVTEECLGELSYLQCIIKETLRLHPPGPLVPRECREQCRILGYDVPKGTTVLVNVWAISRDPECWDEPEEFVPERFVASARDFKGNSFEFIPFGAGRRICPGMLFGLATIELALASLLFHFDWSLPDGTLPSELDMTETMGVAARKKVPLWLRPTPHVYLPG
ncbi:hypothetical protein ACQJBY_004772 [Aegilops geniculata]